MSSSPRPLPASTAASSPGSEGSPDPPDRASYKVCPQVPSLRCKNGSTCQPGVASFDARHSHLSLQSHESGFYCKCLPGFIGHECTIRVDDCDGDTGYDPSDPAGVLMSCYHGSKCRANGSGFYCDCEKLNEDSGPTAAKFAGLMCQHESTGLCAASLMGEISPNHQFCTNHGKCVKMVHDGEPHPGCVCKDGWLGDHCEFRQDPMTTLKQSEHVASATAGKVLFSFLMIAMGCVTVAIFILLVKGRRKENESCSCARALGDAGIAEGGIDADGCGKQGNQSNKINVNMDGDMELTLKEQDINPPRSAKAEIV